MNQSSIISKFIDKCGELDPKPNYHYAEGSTKRRYGLTTEPGTVLQFWRERFFRDHQKYPNIKVSAPSEVLPRIHQEYDKWFYDYWTQQLPNSTFWIVEFPTFKNTSVDGFMYGYPIGRMVKCRNCGTEMAINDWSNKLLNMNHPECQCSCDTYDDFCGCRRRREMAQFDRIRRQSTIRKHFMRNHWDMA